MFGGQVEIVHGPSDVEVGISVEPIYEPDAALGAATPIERELTD